ncbi:hypothetical protein ACG2LH_14470 [Zhouia sp. PK063]|uniref:hypothetical protein n=1 Tax=Zhouia sp. PK063 TaxID=3373602 RepID=UPI0037A4C0EF
MKKIIVALLLVVTAVSYGQKQVYESKSFDKLSKDHKTIAILPFLATINLKDHQLSDEEIKAIENKEGYEVQNALENFFVKRKSRVEFQDINLTNTLLTKANISMKNLDIYTTKELSEVLGVDAVISGTVTLNSLISDASSKSFSFLSLFTGEADYGRITIKISDGKTAKMLWKYEMEINKKSGKSMNEIVQSMMKKAARKFPYDKR